MNGAGGFRVHGARRFIQKQKVRVFEQRSNDGQTLLFAARQIGRDLIDPVAYRVKTEGLKTGADFLIGMFMKWIEIVAETGAEPSCTLPGVTDPERFWSGNCSGVVRVQAGDAAQECCFSASVFSRDGNFFFKTDL